MKMPGFWNGEPCEIEVIRIRMIESPNVPVLFWGKAFYGEELQAVRVFYHNEEPFVIDNEDGMGYKKVTAGKGSPQYGHRSVFAYEEIGPVAPIDIHPWNSETHSFMENKIRKWQEKNHPEEYNRLKILRESAPKFR